MQQPAGGRGTNRPQVNPCEAELAACWRNSCDVEEVLPDIYSCYYRVLTDVVTSEGDP